MLVKLARVLSQLACLDLLSPREAVADAVKIRLRPIAMSTLIMVCGLAPLVFLPALIVTMLTLKQQVARM